MVGSATVCYRPGELLSVLALSSRFDGLHAHPTHLDMTDSFSTRSVESF